MSISTSWNSYGTRCARKNIKIAIIVIDLYKTTTKVVHCIQIEVMNLSDMLSGRNLSNFATYFSYQNCVTHVPKSKH